VTNKSKLISQVEFNEWRESIATKQFFEVLLREADVRRRMMASGIGASSTYEIGEKYLRLQTIAETYEGIPHVSYEDFLEDEENATSHSGLSGIGEAG
jgi:hypothetical protein